MADTRGKPSDPHGHLPCRDGHLLEGHRMMRLRDTLGPLFQSTDVAQLFPALGQPALDPAGLALVTVVPCLEGLADRQAAEHVRRCIDWQ